MLQTNGTIEVRSKKLFVQSDLRHSWCLFEKNCTIRRFFSCNFSFLGNKLRISITCLKNHCLVLWMHRWCGNGHFNYEDLLE